MSADKRLMDKGLTRRACFKLPFWALKEITQMPDDFEINSAHWDYLTQTLTVILTSPRLPLVQHGMRMQEITPTIHVKYSKEKPIEYQWNWEQNL